MMMTITNRALKGLAIIIMAGSVAACGGFSLVGPSGPPPDVYDLSPKSTFDADLPTVDWQLVVEEPVSSRALDTDRIMIKSTPFSIGYMSGGRWSDRAPRMIQTRLVESFENSGRIVAVGRQVIGLRGDYNLKGELREFQAEFFDNGDGSSILVRMNFKIIQMPAANIIASTTFSRRVALEDTNVNAIIVGFDDALGWVMKRAVQWTLRTVDQYRTEHAEELGFGDISMSLDDLERQRDSLTNRVTTNVNPAPQDELGPGEETDAVPASAQ